MLKSNTKNIKFKTISKTKTFKGRSTVVTQQFFKKMFFVRLQKLATFRLSVVA